MAGKKAPLIKILTPDLSKSVHVSVVRLRNKGCKLVAAGLAEQVRDDAVLALVA